MLHAPPKSTWVLLAVLLAPVSGVLAIRHAAGDAARPDPGPANARVWVTDLPGSTPGAAKGQVTVRTLGLVPAGDGAEIPLTSPTGGPMRFDLRSVGDGRIALAGTGVVPSGRYAWVRVGLENGSLDLPLDLSLGDGRELDLLLDLDPLPRPLARVASLRQR